MDENEIVDEEVADKTIEELLAEAQLIADNPDATEEDKARFDEIMLEVARRQSHEEMSRKLANVKKSYFVHSSQPVARKTIAAQPEKGSFAEETQRRTFKFAKALNDYLSGRKLTGWEAEYNQEIARNRPFTRGEGFRVPSRYALDLSTGAGAQTVDYKPGQVDYLRAQSILDRLESLGANVYRNVDQATTIILQASDPAFTWIGDTINNTSESNPTYATRQLVPHNAVCPIPLTRKFIQSTVDGEKYVQNQALKAVGLGVDHAIINGTGTNNQPLGLLATPAIQGNSVTFGGAPTWAKVVEMESVVANANGLGGNGFYLTNPKVRGKFKTVAKESGAAMGFIMEPDGSVNGYECLVTSLMPSNLGASPGNKSAILFCGDPSQIHIAFFGGDALDVLVDPYSHSKAGAVLVNVYLDVDIVAAQTGAYSIATDLTA